jgi:hypothetical protein
MRANINGMGRIKAPGAITGKRGAHTEGTEGGEDLRRLPFCGLIFAGKCGILRARL